MRDEPAQLGGHPAQEGEVGAPADVGADRDEDVPPPDRPGVLQPGHHARRARVGAGAAGGAADDHNGVAVEELPVGRGVGGDLPAKGTIKTEKKRTLNC